MWTTTRDKNYEVRRFSTPPPPTATGKSRQRWCQWSEEKKTKLKSRSSPPPQLKADLFHVIHKVPSGDSPYVRAKHIQLIEKDPSRAISLFWAAINSGDRVDSALKDMAVVMKQLNRSDEAIEAIKSFRHLCPLESQESLDNVLVELYKRSGRIEEQIEMLKCKVKTIEEGIALGGKKTKSARSQGKKIQITIEQEYSRLLGNLAWAYLQQNNFKSAEELYRKALSLEPDKNKQCNLAICLMHMSRMTEAKFLLQTIQASLIDGELDESYVRSFERATQILTEFESKSGVRPIAGEEGSHKEIRMPSTLLINRNSEGLPTFTDGGRNYVSGSRMSVFGYDKEALLLNEQTTESCLESQHENKISFSDSDRGHSNYTSFGLVKCSQSSSFVDALKKGSYSENLYERTADFGSKRNEKWVGTGGREIGSFHKKAYASSVPGRGTPKVPFTQPRECSWSSFSCGDQRRGALLGDSVVGGCNRKLSFEQPMMMAHENSDGQLPASNEMSKAALQKSRSGSTFISGYWRKRWSWGNLAEVNNESALQHKPPEPLVAANYATRSGEAFSDGDWDRSCNISSTGSSVILTETLENNSFIKRNCGKPDYSHEGIADNLTANQELESQSQNLPVSGNLEHSQDISSSRSSKKTWADMVEEDEQELLNHCPQSELVYPSQDSSFSIHTPSRRCPIDGWNSGEEFNDENMNSNIIYPTLTPLNQVEKLSQNMESLELKDGYYTQPAAAASVNRTVRRSLCFDQPAGRTDNYGSSPLPKKVLNFQGYNSSLESEREYCTSGSGIKLSRRNRLKVFRDITLSSESPQQP